MADEAGESAFGGLAELIVVRGLLADNAAAAAVAGVEPFAGGSGGSGGAVEANAGTHLDEGSALGKLGGIFELDADEGDALIILKLANGADGDFVAGLGLADGMPVAGGEENEADHQDGGKYDSRED